MAKEKITVYRYTCERCEHEWIPREITVSLVFVRSVRVPTGTDHAGP